LSANVYWGTPTSRQPAADDLVHRDKLVEGQRLDEWLTGLIGGTTTQLDPSRVDTVWRTIVMGIGRPDPLS